MIDYYDPNHALYRAEILAYGGDEGDRARLAELQAEAVSHAESEAILDARNDVEGLLEENRDLEAKLHVLELEIDRLEREMDALQAALDAAGGAA